MLYSPSEPQRLELDGVAYYLRVPTVAERTRFRTAVRTAGGRQWSRYDLYSCLIQGIREILHEPEDTQLRDRCIGEIEGIRNALITEIRAGQAEGEDSVAFLTRLARLAEASPTLREVERIVTDSYAPYAERLADNEAYPVWSGLTAARLFLTDWEGINAKLVRNNREVAEESLQKIPEPHLPKIGAFLESLLAPKEEDLKNSLSESGGSSDQIPSSSTEPSKPRRNTRSKTSAGTSARSESLN